MNIIEKIKEFMEQAELYFKGAYKKGQTVLNHLGRYFTAKKDIKKSTVEPTKDNSSWKQDYEKLIAELQAAKKELELAQNKDEQEKAALLAKMQKLEQELAKLKESEPEPEVPSVIVPPVVEPPVVLPKPEPPKYAGAVVDILLVNAGRDIVVGSLADGQEIDLAKMLIAFEAKTTLNGKASNVGAFKWEILQNAVVIQTINETGAPYVYPGNKDKNYLPSILPVGEYVIRAIPYDKKNGQPGQSLERRFRLIDTKPEPTKTELPQPETPKPEVPNPTVTVPSLSSIAELKSFEGQLVQVNGATLKQATGFTADNVVAYAGKKGVYVRQELLSETPYINPIWYGTDITGKVDAVKGLTATIKAADTLTRKLGKIVEIESDKHVYLLSKPSGNYSLTVPQENINFRGIPTLKSNCKNPKDPEEGYPLVYWSGKNGRMSPILDSGKDNTDLAVTPKKVTKLFVIDAPGFKGVFNLKGAQGYGIECNSDKSEISVKGGDAGYTALRDKIPDNGYIYRPLLEISQSTIHPRARSTGYILNGTASDTTRGAGNILKEARYGKILLKDCIVLTECQVTGKGEKELNMDYPFIERFIVEEEFRVQMNRAYTYPNGDKTSFHSSKFENVLYWYAKNGYVTSTVEGMAGIKWYQTHEAELEYMHTNLFNFTAPIKKLTVDTWEQVRTSDFQGNQFQSIDGRNCEIHIKNLILNDGKFKPDYKNYCFANLSGGASLTIENVINKSGINLRLARTAGNVKNAVKVLNKLPSGIILS